MEPRRVGLVLASIALALSLSIQSSFAQVTEENARCIIEGCNVGEPVGEPKYLDRHMFAWNLFYKMMTAAFIVGAAVQGVLVFIIFRFKEKKVKGVAR